MTPRRARRERAVDDVTLGWARRGVWAICVGLYVTVFIGGISGGGNELTAMARGLGFALVAAVLGRIAVAFAERAEVVLEEGPMTDQVGPLGSLVEIVPSTNVAQHIDEAEAA